MVVKKADVRLHFVPIPRLLTLIPFRRIGYDFLPCCRIYAAVSDIALDVAGEILQAEGSVRCDHMFDSAGGVLGFCGWKAEDLLQEARYGEMALDHRLGDSLPFISQDNIGVFFIIDHPSFLEGFQSGGDRRHLYTEGFGDILDPGYPMGRFEGQYRLEVIFHTRGERRTVFHMS